MEIPSKLNEWMDKQIEARSWRPRNWWQSRKYQENINIWIEKTGQKENSWQGIQRTIRKERKTYKNGTGSI